LDGTAVAVIAVPCFVYVVTSIHRHLSGEKQSLDDKIMDVGNVFGFVALIAMSVFLIPVARHSSIVHSMGWSPASAVRLHIWLGRIVVAGVLLHGGMHIYRWMGIAGESLMPLLIPPAGCWTMYVNNAFAPVCKNSETDCSCYHHFRNLVGILAAVGMLLIGITSLDSVRRRCYSLFYKVHVIAGPLVLFFTIVHWNRSMLYLASSILYYVATSFPVLIESQSRRHRDGGVKIVSVEQILEPAFGNSLKTCISLTVHASDVAMRRYRCGLYVKLSAPLISQVSHPFTISTVPGQNNQLRLIFRATGNFTGQLAKGLFHPLHETPNIYLDGYLGSPDRVAQVLSHDAVALVAGGIGITPYLSLLHNIHSELSKRGHGFPINKLTLHWICRDASLIEYVTSEYFEPLLRMPNEAGLIRIVIHWTGVATNESHRVYPIVRDTENPQTCELISRVSEDTSGGTPFTPSRFSPGSKAYYIGNLPTFLSFVTVTWIGLVAVWHFYSNVQDKTEVLSRIWSPIFVIVLAVSVAVAVNLSFRFVFEDNDALMGADWTPVKQESDECIESLELHNLSHAEVGGDKDTNGLRLDDTIATKKGKLRTVVLEKKEGRPTMHHLLNSLDEAAQPGLFACGPASLMQELRTKTKDRGSIECRRFATRESRIAFYEETFAM
jgi:NAD(P)H-flavin reductase